MLYLAFISGACLLFAGVLSIFLWTRYRQAKIASGPDDAGMQAAGDMAALNVESFRQRLDELEHDYQSQILDPEDYAQQKIQLQHALLQSVEERSHSGLPALQRRNLVRLLLLAGLIPVFTVLAYVLWQDRKPVWSYWNAQQKFGQAATDILQGHRTDLPPEAAANGIGLLQTLQTLTYRHPDRPEYWYNLGTGYRFLEAYDLAGQAFTRAIRLAPDNQDYILQAIQTDFYASQGVLRPENREKLLQVLKTTPDHEGAMMLLAMGAYRNSDYPEAVEWLEKINRHTFARTGKTSTELDRLITEARKKQSEMALSQVTLTVTVSPAIQALVKPGNNLFVFIRAATGLPMPYAAIKLPSAALAAGKVMVKLGDQGAMIPGRTLSVAKRDKLPLVAGARISRPDSATGEPGDPESGTVAVTVPGEAVLNIDHVRP